MTPSPVFAFCALLATSLKPTRAAIMATVALVVLINRLRVRQSARSRSDATVDRRRDRWDCPTMILTLDAKRRFSIPAALAPAEPGDAFDARYDRDEDEIVLRRVKRKSNWLEVWKQCPVSMDDLPPRSREMPKKLKL